LPPSFDDKLTVELAVEFAVELAVEFAIELVIESMVELVVAVTGCPLLLCASPAQVRDTIAIITARAITSPKTVLFISCPLRSFNWFCL
jgi:hypothetical protein